MKSCREQEEKKKEKKEKENNTQAPEWLHKEA